MSPTHTEMWRYVDPLGLQPRLCGCVDQTPVLIYPLKKTRPRWCRVVVPPYFCSGEHPHVIHPPPLYSLFCWQSPPHSRPAITDSSPLATVPHGTRKLWSGRRYIKLHVSTCIRVRGPPGLTVGRSKTTRIQRETKYPNSKPPLMLQPRWSPFIALWEMYCSAEAIYRI